MNFTRRLSFVEMTDAEVELYAMRQAQLASRTTRIIEHCCQRKMTGDEEARYAQAICDAILYFNRRDPAHAAAMRFRREMKERDVRQRERMAESEQKQKMDIVII